MGDIRINFDGVDEIPGSSGINSRVSMDDIHIDMTGGQIPEEGESSQSFQHRTSIVAPLIIQTEPPSPLQLNTTSTSQRFRINLNNMIPISVRPFVSQITGRNDPLHLLPTASTTNSSTTSTASSTNRRINYSNILLDDDPLGESEPNHLLSHDHLHHTHSRENEITPEQHDQEETVENAAILTMTMLKAGLQYLPLILILLLKATVDNFKTIFEFVIVNAWVFFLNTKLKVEIEKKAQRSLIKLTYLLVTAFAIVAILQKYLYEDNTEIGIFLYYRNLQNITLTQLLYQVIFTDCILKFFTMLIKIVITMLPVRICHLKQRNRTYAFVEHLSQFYRCLAPIEIWLHYLMIAYDGWKISFNGVFSGIYLSYKGFEIVQRFKPLQKSARIFLRNVNYGKTPTLEELNDAGEQCPICHESYTTPVILECKHVFCEMCVTTWFSNEQTCPLCRAKVAEPLDWQCGSTSMFYQIC